MTKPIRIPKPVEYLFDAGDHYVTESGEAVRKRRGCAPKMKQPSTAATKTRYIRLPANAYERLLNYAATLAGKPMGPIDNVLLNKDVRDLAKRIEAVQSDGRPSNNPCGRPKLHYLVEQEGCAPAHLEIEDAAKRMGLKKPTLRLYLSRDNGVYTRTLIDKATGNPTWIRCSRPKTTQ